MEKAQSKKPTLQDIFRWVIQSIGTFLYVFLMMHTTIIGIMGVNNYRWLLPYFSLPAYIVCFTISAKYWIGEDDVRRITYTISTIVSAILILPQTAFMVPSYVSLPLLRTVMSVSLSILLILFVVLRTRIKTTCNQQIGASETAMQEQMNAAKPRKTIQIICLLSICCVLFENWQASIMNAYGLLNNIDLAKSFLSFSPLPLSILSAILLAKFVKAVFVQWKPSLD